MESPYLPKKVRIVEATDETPDVRTLFLEFVDASAAERFAFAPGQFGGFTVFGAGECPFCIASSPTRGPRFACSFRRVGKVTAALWDCEPGDVIGFRGPYGSPFPIEKMRGRSVVFVGGGIGMAPLRSLIEFCLDHREYFRALHILNGARTVRDLVYEGLSPEWQRHPDVTLVRTVDPGGEEKGWKGKVGLIPPVLEEMAPEAHDAVAVVCGPPVMLRFALRSLEKLGFAKEQIVTTLENRMKCGVGKCGRCNVGPWYVCRDGPVLTAAELETLPPDH